MRLPHIFHKWSNWYPIQVTYLSKKGNPQFTIDEQERKCLVCGLVKSRKA